jgi:hypothetical protein
VPGVESGAAGDRREPGPTADLDLDVRTQRGLTGAVAIEAGPLLGLELEQLECANCLAGRRHDAEPPVEAGQQDVCGVDVEHVDASVAEDGEQVGDVEVVDDVSARSVSVRSRPSDTSSGAEVMPRTCQIVGLLRIFLPYPGENGSEGVTWMHEAARLVAAGVRVGLQLPVRPTRDESRPKVLEDGPRDLTGVHGTPHVESMSYSERRNEV